MELCIGKGLKGDSLRGIQYQSLYGISAFDYLHDVLLHYTAEFFTMQGPFSIFHYLSVRTQIGILTGH